MCERLAESTEVNDVKLVSIVIATYNAEQHVGLTLESIARLPIDLLDMVEVIVVDGKSSDRTLSIVNSYSEIVDVIVSEVDEGIYDAMNKGGRIAGGKWLHFLNAGDRFDSDASLTPLFDVLKTASQDELWAVSGATNMGGQDGQRQVIPNLPHRWFRHALGLQPHCHQACWFRADVFHTVGGHALDLGLVGDFDLILRFGLLRRPIEIKSLLIEYQGGGVSEQRRKEIKRLLHEVRVLRLDLQGRWSRFDTALSTAIAAINSVRITGGRIKRRLTT